MSPLAIALLAAAMPASPAAVPEGFRLAAETRNFSFYARGGEQVLAAKSQGFLDETSRKLGAQVVGKTSYFRYSWPEELAFVVGGAAAGATGAYMASGDVHSTKPFDAHEIVHRVAFQLGNPGALFQEGLAVELGDGGRFGDAKVDHIARGLAGRFELETLLERFTSLGPEARYPLAGSFVRFLVRRHGLGKVAEFFKACPDERARDVQFARVMGTSLQDEGREWIAALAR